MRSDSSVVADPANGVVILAGERVAMSPPDANGAIRFGGSMGTTLRPLSFEQRTNVVAAASAQTRAVDSVAAAVLSAATVERGTADGDPVLLEVLALWLAGAAWDAPNFSATTLLVARGSGWSPRDLLAAPATEVDRLAVYLGEQQQASEWKTLLFEAPPAEELGAVRARFSDQLLRRSAMAVANETPERDLEHAPAARDRAMARSDEATSHAAMPARRTPDGADRAPSAVDSGLGHAQTSGSPAAAPSQDRERESPLFHPIEAPSELKLVGSVDWSGTRMPSIAGSADEAIAQHNRAPSAPPRGPAASVPDEPGLPPGAPPLASIAPASSRGPATELPLGGSTPPASALPSALSSSTATALPPRTAVDASALAVDLFAPPDLFATAVTVPQSQRWPQHVVDDIAEPFANPVADATSRGAFDVARILAAILEDEADLRGIDR